MASPSLITQLAACLGIKPAPTKPAQCPLLTADAQNRARLQGELTNLQAELVAAKAERTRQESRIAELKNKKAEAAKVSRQILAEMGIDCLPADDTPVAMPSGEPADLVAFVAEHRRLQSSKGTAEAGRFYAKYGKKFGF